MRILLSRTRFSSSVLRCCCNMNLVIHAFIIFDYVSLPALNSFSVVPSNPYVYNSIVLTPMEEARLVGLFHRSDRNLTSLTLSIPFAVDTFLIPILIQSLTLQYLDVKVDTQMTGGVFRSLSRSRVRAQPQGSAYRRVCWLQRLDQWYFGRICCISRHDSFTMEGA